MTDQKLQVKCPQCGLLIFYSIDNPHRPFCSERCKIIDLGAWASENYKVPVESQNYNEKELEQLYTELEKAENDADSTTVADRKQQE